MGSVDYVMVDIEHGFWKIVPFHGFPERSNIKCVSLTDQFEQFIAFQMNTALAEHIVRIHNEWWDTYVWDSYFSNIEWSLIDELGETPMTEDDWFDYNKLDDEDR